MQDSDDERVKLKRWVASDEGTKELQELEVSPKELVDFLCKDLDSYSRHIFNADWQYKEFKSLKENLPKGWLLLVVDFAENYRCRQQKEISSAYFKYKQAEIFTAQLSCEQEKSCMYAVNSRVR